MWHGGVHVRQVVVVFVFVTFVIFASSMGSASCATPPDTFEYVYKDESLTLVRVDDEPLTQLTDIATGVYSLKLAGDREGCGLGDEYLGFTNRTCTSSLVPSKTAGPVLRGPSSSMLWREWMVVVKNREDDRVDVSLQAFVHPALEGQGKCLGYVSNFYGNPKFRGTCVIPPYGNGLFLNGTENTATDGSTNPQVLSIKKAAAGGGFEIMAANKPDECMRALAAEDCHGRAVLVEDPAKYFVDVKTYITWKLTKRYDVVVSGTLDEAAAPAPSSTPPAVAPSPSTPRPAAPVPGPVISAPSSTSAFYVDVLIPSTGGSDRCSVTSIVITVTGMGFLPETFEVSASRQGLATTGVTIPLRMVGNNSISAVGKCQNGEPTESSNQLSVWCSPVFPGKEPAAPRSWSVVGSAGFSDGYTQYTSIRLDSSNTPYVAYRDGSNAGKATVMKYDGSGSTGWSAVGSAGFSSGSAFYTSLALDSSNTPYVAYRDVSISFKATVMKYVGSGSTGWSAVGSAGFSGGAVLYTSLALDSSNTPYVAYRDVPNSGKATVMKYVSSGSTGWSAVGSAGFSAGGALYTSLALDSSNTPYVAFSDGQNSNKATVMKYVSSGSPGWYLVGNAGFSGGSVDYVSLALDSSNTPYVAFSDGSNTAKATVMKYDGSVPTGWSAVGSAGFSSGSASYTSLSLDSSGTPYVAYRDGSNADKVTVMKYVGSGPTGWSAVGSAGFSAGVVDFVSLALKSSNTPYVAFSDVANSDKTTVMKFA